MGSYYDKIMGDAESRRSLHPRAKDMADTLAMINGIRVSEGYTPLPSLPTAIQGNAGECLYARAFGDMCQASVDGSGGVTFTNSDIGRRLSAKLGRLPGGTMTGDYSAKAPPAFGRVISAFDGSEFPEFDPFPGHDPDEY